MKVANLFFVVFMTVIFSSCQDSVSRADELRSQYKFSEAFELYEQAANEGNSYAKWRLAKAYGHGDGVNLDFKEAMRLLDEASKEGSDEATCDMALCYLYGWYGTEKDQDKGFKMLKEIASKSESTYVKVRYARDLFYGFSDVEDNEQAEKIISDIKDKDDEIYLRFMGDIYSSGGDKIERNIEQAVKYYQMSFKKGDSYSAYCLANRYSVGDEKCQKDIKKEIEWLNKGIDANCDDCMCVMAGICLSEDTVVKNMHNIPKAIELLKRATKHGSGEAYTRLGTLYLLGKYVDKDDNEAFICYTKAYELRDAIGAGNLGWAYLNGIGCEKDPAKGIEIWKNAVDFGSGYAADNLFRYYYQSMYGGTTEAKNYELAKKYLLKAAKLGDANGCYNLGVMYFYGNGFFEKNEFQAFTYIKIAADKGLVDACSAVAYMYENGIGCEKDPSEAKKYKDKTMAKENKELD